MKFENLKGRRFGRLVVIDREVGESPTKWMCQCDCGRIKSVRACHLKSGAIVSCKCFWHEEKSHNRKVHGRSATRPYQAWMHMMQRCYNPNSAKFSYYGGRGIRVYPPWHKFENFWTDMSKTFDPKLELDRIDNEGHYSPTNCRWATRRQQTQNTRQNRFIVTPNGRMCVSEAARQYGVEPSLLYRRLNKGMGVEQALGLS